MENEISLAEDGGSQVELQNIRLVSFVKDESILNRIIEDKTLWLFGIIILFITVRKIKNILVLTTHGMIFVLLDFVIVIVGLVFWEVFRKREVTQKPLFNMKVKLWTSLPFVLFVINIILLFTFCVAYLATNRVTYAEIESQFFTATWEQLMFAVIIPALLLKILPYKFVIKRRNIPLTYVAILISAVLFAVLHYYKYGYLRGFFIIYILMGYFFHFIGFHIPSISITLHWLFNITKLAFT